MADHNARAVVSVYLLLEQGGKWLFGLRQNVPYANNMWMPVAGHGHDNESAKQALCREAQLKLGIDICPQDLQVLHIMHRLENGRMSFDSFMRSSVFKGDIHNTNAEKCARLEFFAPDALPENVVPYVAAALDMISQGKFYSERGFVA